MGRRAFETLMTPFFDAPGDGSGGGAAAGTAGAAGGEGTSQGTPAAGATATAAGAGTGTGAGDTRTGAGTSGQFTYTEDRSKWIPPHRFQEVNGRLGTLQEQIAERDRKIAALAGTSTPDPATQKAEQVKEAFLQMFPQFKHFVNLTDEQMQRLIASPESAARADEFEQAQWRRHGATQMSTVFASVADALGTDALSNTQKEDLTDGFARWFKAKCKTELEASGGSESATFARYENGDPKLLEEFTKRYLADWIEPARRKATTQTLNRTRPVPNSQGRTQVTSVNRPATFKTLDERLDFAADLAKERGAVFGR